MASRTPAACSIKKPGGVGILIFLLASPRRRHCVSSCPVFMARFRIGVAALALQLAHSSHVRASRTLRFETEEDDEDIRMKMDVYGDLRHHRILAGGGGGGEGTSAVCHKSGSFLGVGNVECLHQNLGTAIFLLAIIIVVSLLFERIIQSVRQAIACPQLKKIVNRIFEEVMIMGFISMVIFTLNTSGLMEKLHFTFDGELSGSERLHFYEFFHYLVFLTMIYFIVIVLLLLFVGTVVPKLIWEIKNLDDSDSDSDEVHDSDNQDDDDDGIKDTRWSRSSARGRDDSWLDPTFTSEDRLSRRDFTSGYTPPLGYRASALRMRANSGMDLVQGSRAYALLLQRYQREGWCFMFNVKKQWHLWKSFEILAYNICQHRSGYIYKNPTEMERLFSATPKFHSDGSAKPMAYDQYHILCMRNLLYHISHLHYSAFFVLLVIAVVPVLYPAYDHWIFIGVGVMLLLVNIVIFFKVLQILRGIVDDRLRVFTTHDIQRRMHHRMINGRAENNPRKRPTLRVVAQSVRAVIRMQMSALCHHQLHYHNDRFWFNSPRFLLRLFHFATIGQAFYLVWFSLVEIQTVASTPLGGYLIFFMALLPFLAMCIITPMTMPSLVLVMSLTGIFVELNGKDPKSGIRPTQTETKTRIRLMRRSYLRSYHTDNEDPSLPVAPSDSLPRPLEDRASPTAVFLRMYDSPKAAAQHGKLLESPRKTLGERDDGTLLMKRSVSGGMLSSSQSDEVKESTRTRRSFDLTSYHHSTNNAMHDSNHRKASLDSNYHQYSPRPAKRDPEPALDIVSVPTPPLSPAFKNYCSKYGGYPDA